MGLSLISFMLDDELAALARRLGINVSTAARDGVFGAVRSALAAADRAGYERTPEVADRTWDNAEAWGAL